MEALHVEHVLVFPTSLFVSLGSFQGFSPDVDRYFAPLLASDHLSYRPRPEMEQSPEFKQLIPYVLFRCVDKQGGVSLFQYARGKGQGETRLHGRRSVGVGGHISLDDDRGDSSHAAYREGMERELREEVLINAPFREQLVGLINDDSSEVGRVHLGVVHLVDLESPGVIPREDNMHDAGFRPIAELLQDIQAFETWSQFVLRALFTPSV